MSANTPIGALDAIFTCDICQASISDIYSPGGPGAAQTNFQDGRPHRADQRVTCLWLTQCMHLTCGAHLEGGGAPFHAIDELPRAPCPYCLKTKGDATPAPLYAVRGLQKGNYDEAIPSCLFEAPPVYLQADDIRMQALQFQYASLIRFGTSMLTKKCETELTTRKAENALKTATAANSALDKENKALRAELASLNEVRTENMRWKERMPKLRHYLNLWPSVMQEVKQLRAHLSQLGYAVPEPNYTYQLVADETPVRTEGGATAQEKGFGATRVPTDNSMSGYVTAPTNISESDSGQKRKFSQYVSQDAAPDDGQRLQVHNQGDSSAQARDRADIAAPSDLTGNIRGGLARDDGNPLHSGPIHKEPIRSYEGNTRKSSEQEAPRHHSPMLTTSLDPFPGKYTMSGAIPQPAVPVEPRIERQLFQPLTPTRQIQRTDQPHQQREHNQQENMYHVYDKRPIELSRAEPPQTDHRNFQAQPQSYWERPPIAPPPMRGNEAGHAVSRQSHPQPYRQPYRPPQFNRAPITPLPRRYHASSSKVANRISSPFFTRDQGGVRSGLSPSLAGLTANARVGTVSKPLPPRKQQDWSQPRSLNGLSFVNVPQDQFRNEPLLHTNRTGVSGNNLDVNDPFNLHTPHHTHNTFLKRPNQPQLSSSYFDSTAPQSAMQAPGLYTTARMPPISSFAPAPPSRPVFTRHDALKTVNIPQSYGATSFYQNQERGIDSSRLQNENALGSRNLFSAAGGRRSVKR